MGAPPEIDEDLLHRILGVGGLKTEPAHERPDQAAVAILERADGLRVA